ncbi:MAG: SAM-dependent methyltransferase [Bacteroidetes bacterium HGW-Bacteroidetes-6]|jgi:ubiquinone/menaquinone biosynthesis C-methylase UbiE|nr:MAG: SAM-dependent methyltransferase [Bacteroidetes bacterium HGW-Bacteroidetes-6]
MRNKNIHIHSVEKSGALDSSFRHRFQNPGKILSDYLHPGMTVLDLGCGPGFFTIGMACMLDSSSKVIAADIQTGMLEKVKQKIEESDLECIVQIHQCQEKSLNLTDKIDFVFAFYSFHEMSYPDEIIDEIKLLLKPGGLVYIAEQKFHVSKSSFIDIIEKMRKKGFEITSQPKVFLSRAVVMKMKEQ